MEYETFLFTRIKQRDFTAFVRPTAMTNREVSLLAGAFGYLNDITLLQPSFPALYYFPLGGWLLLLRHYDSGRKHAGREIAVIEGVAVQRGEAERDFALALPHFITHHHALLAIARQFTDIETLEPMSSPRHEWADEIDPVTPEVSQEDEQLLNQFAHRHREDRLLLPFAPRGLALLLTALMDFRMPPLFFAFGTSPDVVNALTTAQIPIDIVGNLTTVAPGLKARDITRRISAEDVAAARAATAPTRTPPQMIAPPSTTIDDTQPSRAVRLQQRKYMTLSEIVSDFWRQLLKRR